MVTDSVTNGGSGNAGTSTTFFYLSPDGTAKGASIGYRYIPALVAGATTGTINTTVNLPTNLTGTYYLLACADVYNQVVESDESNCSPSPTTLVIQ